MNEDNKFEVIEGGDSDKYRKLSREVGHPSTFGEPGWAGKDEAHEDSPVQASEQSKEKIAKLVEQITQDEAQILRLERDHTNNLDEPA